MNNQEAPLSHPPLFQTPEELAHDYRIMRQQREAEAAPRIAALPEGVIPHPDAVEIPQDLRPATGLKRVFNGRRSHKAKAYRQSFVEGRTEAAIHDPHGFTEMRLEGSAGSGIHRTKVHGHKDGFNTFPKQSIQLGRGPET